MHEYQIKNRKTLRRLLWLDTALGTTNAVAWLLFTDFWAGFLGLSVTVIVAIALVNVVYASSALYLAVQAAAPARLVRWLVLANWLWVLVSLVLLRLHFGDATVFGKVFLVSQVIGVGALAWAEGRQVVASDRFSNPK
jgi:hypothetical protein